MTYREGESTATAAPELRGCISWQDPVSGRRIFMQAACLRTIAAVAISAFRAKPVLEIGGILLGKTVPDTETRAILIRDVRLVCSEGPLYNTSPRDAGCLAEALNEYRSATDFRVIGYFRSHIREGLCLSEQDRKLIEQHLRDPESVFLIVRPYEMGVCMAGFFFWQNGRLQMDCSDLEVPFFAPDRNVGDHALPVGQKQIGRQSTAPKSSGTPPAPVARIQAAAQDASDQGAEMDQSPVQSLASGAWPSRSQRSRLVPKWLALVVLFLLCGLAAYWLQFRSRTQLPAAAESPAKTEIGLRVDRNQGGQLNLSWNRDLLALSAVRSAKLTILDGSFQRQLDIDPEQLRFGRITYFPNSDNVQFHLEIYLDADHSLAETVRVSLPGDVSSGRASSFFSPLLPPDSSVPQSRTITSHNHAVPRNAPGALAAKQNVQPAVADGKADLSSTPSAVPAVPAAAKEFVDNPNAAPVSAGEAPRTTAESLNSVAKPANGAGTAVQNPSGDHSGSNAKVTEQAVLPRLTPVQIPLAQNLFAAKVAGARPVSIDMLPRPLRRVLPETRQLGMWTPRSLTVMQVQVRVAENGRVTAARVLNDGGRSNPLLSAQSIVAAKQWRFQPAQSGGKSIPSDYVIIFRFRPAD